MKRHSIVVVFFLIISGGAFLPSCNSTIHIPSTPMGSTPTDTRETLTATPTGSTTVTPAGSSTTLPTATWTPTYTLTGSPTPTPIMTGTNTMTVTPTLTGCDKTCFKGSGYLPTPTLVPNGGSVTVLDFFGSAGCGSNTCLGNTYDYQVSSMSFTVVLTGNLSTEITGVHLWAGGVLVGSTAFNASGFTINFNPLSGRSGPFQLVYDLSSNASGTIQTSLSGVTFSGAGYAVYPLFVGPTLSVGGATPTGSSTGTPTYTSTPTASPTLTGSPTWTSTPQVCVPVPISVAAGVSIMNYGQYQLYAIRTQADWDAYMGTTGAAAPVNFAVQMLLAVNWGTEYCQPGVGQPSLGRVVEYNITSACVLFDHIEVTVTSGSSCTCGGSCVYTMAPTQVNAVVLPTSSLPVSVN